MREIGSAIDTSTEAYRNRRTSRVKRSLTASVLTKPWNFAAQLGIVPILVGGLGAEGFGVVEASTAFASWLTLSNAGLVVGLRNGLMGCLVEGDHLHAKRYVASTLFPLLVIVVALMMMAWFLSPLLAGIIARNGWAREHDVTGAITWAIIGTLLTVLGGIPEAIYSAHQQTERNSYWDTACRLTSLGCCFVAMASGAGVVGAVIAVAVAPAVVRLFNLVALLAHEKPWLRPRPKDIDCLLVRSSIHNGAHFLIMQVSHAVLWRSDAAFVAWAAGPATAGVYSVVRRALEFVYGTFSLAFVPLWPAHGEALRRGDIAWSKKAVRLTLLSGATIAIVGVLAILGVGQPLLSFWAGETLHYGAGVVLAIGAGVLTRVWIDTHSTVLNSMGEFRVQVRWYALTAACYLAIAAILGAFVDWTAMIWSAPVACLLFTNWRMPAMVRALWKRTGTLRFVS